MPKYNINFHMSSKWLLNKSRVHPITQTKQLLLEPAKLLWAGNILLFRLSTGVWSEATTLLLPLPPSSFENGLY